MYNLKNISGLRPGKVGYYALFSLVLLLHTASTARAQTNYYVAANGNDANNGRSPDAPFQSLDKASSLTLQPGDAILLRRGDTFRGTLFVRQSGAPGQSIVIDAYGSGDKPVIAGSLPVTGWTNIGNNTWQASCPSCGNTVSGLYRNSSPLPLSRYPNPNDANKGYLTIQSHSGNNQITSQQALTTNWIGGELVYRARQWITNKGTITGQNGSTMTFSNNSQYGIADGYGFLIQNHPAALDQPGEWCYLPDSKTIRLYDNQHDPNSQFMTATVFGEGVNLTEASFITVRNIRVIQTLSAGMLAVGGSNLAFTGNDILGSGLDAVAVSDTGANVLFENNLIEDANNNGFDIRVYENFVFRGNTVRRIGLAPGRGTNGDGTYSGMQSRCTGGTVIENNVIEDIGYIGISFMNNAVVRNNRVANFCQTKSDGSGIYTWNGLRANVTDVRIQSNIIYNGIGAIEGTPPGGNYSGANGIFLDDCSQNAEVSNNTVFNMRGIGIYLRGASNVSVRNNTSYNNNESQVKLAYNRTCDLRNNAIQDNVFFSRLSNQLAADYESDGNDLGQFGPFDRNYYARPFEDLFKIRAVYNPGTGLTGADLRLDEWQSRFNQDPNSFNSPIVYRERTTNQVGATLLTNNFASNTNGWSVFSPLGNGRAEFDNTNRLDGGSMRLQFATNSGQSSSYMLASIRIGSVTKGKSYQLLFDAVATSDNKRIQVFPRQYAGNFRDLATRAVYALGTNRQLYEATFTANADESDAILVVQMQEDGHTVWLDNIRLQEAIVVTALNPDDYTKLVYNTSFQDRVEPLDGVYRDVKNNRYENQVLVPAFSSIVLMREAGSYTPPPPALREPENPANTLAGLDYQYYEGSWTLLPNFNTLTAKKSGTADQPDLSMRDRDDNFALRFRGYVTIPTDGLYTFYTNSDDGSKLFIGTNEVVNNDGGHADQERSGTIGLKAGVHALTVIYFEGGGGQSLAVSYSGPGIGKQNIPSSAFQRLASGQPPVTPVTLREPENPANALPGLNYQYYEGNWTAIPNFDALTPKKSGAADAPLLDFRDRDDNFAMRFQGYVSVPTDGLYTFHVNSDDGSKLFIGNTQVVDNDGSHGAQERSGSIGLKAGVHALTVQYFEGSSGQTLAVSYNGPGIDKQIIPNQAYSRTTTSQPPVNPPPANLREPENPANALAGLNYQYYEGNWSTLPNFDALTPVKSGASNNPIPAAVRNRENNFAVRYQGYVSVPTDGLYTFYTTSDDGSKLFIGNTQVVNNDGVHGDEERWGVIGLKAGVHALTLTYFQSNGGQSLSVRYNGPGIDKQLVPESAYRRLPVSQPPVDPPPVTPVTLREPENPANAVAGLDYQYYEGTWNALPNMDALPVVKTGTVAEPDLSVRNRENSYALRYKGFISVPADGVYTFFTNSDDGSRLFIGNTLVVDNDSLHGDRERSGTIGLKAGVHALTIQFLQGGGGQVLTVSYSGPSMAKQIIPAAAYRRVPGSQPPVDPPPVTLREPENPANAVAGINYQYYEGNWTAIPNFDALTPKKSGAADAPLLDFRDRDDNFALRFQGYVSVPADGLYTFYTNSDEGSKLFIGNTEVVNNDGIHGNQERSGSIGLKAGVHALTVVYFEATGGQTLAVSYSGPNLGKQAIPNQAYRRIPTSQPPVDPPPANLRNPENPANAVAGLDYQYYEGSWNALPNFDALTPVKTGTAGTVNPVTVRNRESNFAIRYRGYVSVPTDGVYTFFTSSDDGSKLFIGNTQVVDNDGNHPDQERSGTIGLKAGVHALTITYYQGGGGQNLTVSYSGPNLAKQPISDAAFRRVPVSQPPVDPPPVTLREPENPANAVAGLDYQYYEGTWTVLPNFDALTPIKTGTASTVNALTVRNRENNFAIRYRGYISVPADGVYTFFTNSDDGSRLFIGSTEIVENDGIHGDRERSGTIGLKAGVHAMTITYFQGTGGQGLTVSYSGPGVGKQAIPASAYRRVTTSQPPVDPPPASNLREPENPANAVAGLNYQYFEGNWSTLPNFDALAPVKTSSTNVPGLSVRNRENNYALRFQGFVSVPTDGVYTFSTKSDDGTRFFIGTTEVVSNDGIHGDQERSGSIGLKAGVHAMTLVYFQGTGGQSLLLSYEGPGINKQAIPEAAFRRVATGPSTGAGTGLRAQYFNNKELTGAPVLTRVDATVNFDWGNGTAGPGVNADNFGVRWTGQIEAPVTGNYTFITTTDNGVRLWINGALVIDDWTIPTPKTNTSSAIALVGGQRYDVRMDYFDGTFGAIARLQWAYPGQGQQAIPQQRLYPAAGGGRLAAPASRNERPLIYPIPAHDEFTLVPNGDVETLRVVDILGRELMNVSKPDRRQPLRFGGQLPSGPYLLHIEYTDGTHRVEKLLKATR